MQHKMIDLFGEFAEGYAKGYANALYEYHF